MSVEKNSWNILNQPGSFQVFFSIMETFTEFDVFFQIITNNEFWTSWMENLRTDLPENCSYQPHYNKHFTEL